MQEPASSGKRSRTKRTKAVKQSTAASSAKTKSTTLKRKGKVLLKRSNLCHSESKTSSKRTKSTPKDVVEGYIFPDNDKNKVMVDLESKVYCRFCKKAYRLSNIFNHMKRQCSKNKDISKEKLKQTKALNASRAKVCLAAKRKQSNYYNYSVRIMKQTSIHKMRDKFLG